MSGTHVLFQTGDRRKALLLISEEVLGDKPEGQWDQRRPEPPGVVLGPPTPWGSEQLPCSTSRDGSQGWSFHLHIRPGGSGKIVRLGMGRAHGQGPAHRPQPTGPVLVSPRPLCNTEHVLQNQPAQPLWGGPLFRSWPVLSVGWWL